MHHVIISVSTRSAGCKVPLLQLLLLLLLLMVTVSLALKRTQSDAVH